MSFENPSEKVRPEKLAEALAPLFVDTGIVSKEHCVQLALNPALREAEIAKQTENLTILLSEQGIDDVSPAELAEKLVDFLTLEGLGPDPDTDSTD